MIDFNSLPMNGETGLRALATKTYGITNVKILKKAELVAQLEAIEATREAEQAAKDAADAAKVAPATKATKKSNGKCSLCGIRPRGAEAKMAGHADYCDPCLNEAEWENEHADNDHTETPEPGCWVCHPEFNRAQATYVQRQGTSRLGMRMSVPVRAAGEVKAHTTVARLTAKGMATEVKTRTKTGTVELWVKVDQTTTLILVWDLSGAYRYDVSAMNVAGKNSKVRNVKAALKMLGIKI